MKLAALYNAFDGLELLEGSIKCLADHVDLIVIIYQVISNSGENYLPIEEPLTYYERIQAQYGDKICLVNFVPDLNNYAGMNERAKRNIGLDYARVNHCTHFLHIDCDEYYEDFGLAKSQFIASGRKGSVCKLYTYFKKPTLRFDSLDGYYVPFIHELEADTKAGTSSYPFYVDPTRCINQSDVIELSTVMQHFSWVRKDIDRKFRNSSAYVNLINGTMLKDYNNPEVGFGFYVKDYDKRLIQVEDHFGIGEFK